MSNFKNDQKDVKEYFIQVTKVTDDLDEDGYEKSETLIAFKALLPFALANDIVAFYRDYFFGAEEGEGNPEVSSTDATTYWSWRKKGVTITLYKYW